MLTRLRSAGKRAVDRLIEARQEQAKRTIDRLGPYTRSRRLD